jgi:hypothetical protein
MGACRSWSSLPDAVTVTRLPARHASLQGARSESNEQGPGHVRLCGAGRSASRAWRSHRSTSCTQPVQFIPAVIVHGAIARVFGEQFDREGVGS